jgi:hypothetical protein
MKSISITLFIAVILAMMLACSTSGATPTAYPTYTSYPTYTQEPPPTPTIPAPTNTPEPSPTPTPTFPFALTDERFHETEDIGPVCALELDPRWRIADWNDILAYYQVGNSIEAFASTLALTEDNLYLVTYNGERWFNALRHYFIAFHNHNLPIGFLAHADIADHFIDLGSWHGLEAQVLCFLSITP